MKEKFKNKKILIIAGAFLLVLVGVTFAYFETSDTFTNIFDAANYGSSATEVFTSPSNWTPGTTTPKSLTVANTGDLCENVRISYTEEWEDANGNSLPLKQNGNKAAIINLNNRTDWVKRGDYYYYNHNLQPNQSTNSFISSVTFNPAIENDYECTQSGGTRTCTSTETGYDSGTYTLSLNIETIQCDMAEEEWEIDPTELEAPATFDTGPVVAAKLKTMAAGESLVYDDADELITAFIREDSLPSGFTPSAENTISSSSSLYPIYAWFEEDLEENDGTEIIYFYSETSDLEFNNDSSYLFSYMHILEDIDSVADIDTSNVTNMESMFDSDMGISSLIPFTDWDVSNVTNMECLFGGLELVSSLEPLANWDVSSVTMMCYTFWGCTGLTTLQGLEDWTTSSVEDLSGVFSECYSLTSLQGLEGWDTSGVKRMEYAFDNCTSLTSLQPLSSWNTTNVTTMSSMFLSCTSLTDASAINGWNISAVTYTSNTSSENGFYEMFWNCNVHPTFTNRSGTWDSNGSFIPTT